MVNNTQRIRELNDELRQHLLGSFAVMTPGVAALGQEAVEHIVKQSPSSTIFVTPTTRTKNTTLVHSKSTANRSFSRSTTTTRA